jgi:hypothetical protein
VHLYCWQASAMAIIKLIEPLTTDYLVQFSFSLLLANETFVTLAHERLPSLVVTFLLGF